MIQEKEHMLLHEIISQKGLDGFNEVENKINAQLDVSHSIIATGGSVVYGKEAMQHLSSIGTIIYLCLPFDDLVKRLGDLEERGVSMRPSRRFWIFTGNVLLYMKNMPILRSTVLIFLFVRL